MAYPPYIIPAALVLLAVAGNARSKREPFHRNNGHNFIVRHTGDVTMSNSLFISVLLAGIALAGASATAGERLNDGLMGAGAGALVGGPVGAVAGGAIGYVEGPNISHGIHHRRHRHHIHD